MVSHGELEHVRRVGFPASQILCTATASAPLTSTRRSRPGRCSIDSEFDLAHVQARAVALARGRMVLLRVNPDIDPQVHPYISTGLLESKFGMAEATIERLLPTLSALFGPAAWRGRARPALPPGIDAEVGAAGARCGAADPAAGFGVCAALGHAVDTLDMGGGLGIDYSHRSTAPAPPSPHDLIDGLRPLLEAPSGPADLEPGRSIVGRCGRLIGRVLGIKRHGQGSDGWRAAAIAASCAPMPRWRS